MRFEVFQQSGNVTVRGGSEGKTLHNVTLHYSRAVEITAIVSIIMGLRIREHSGG
jgi:hypothetical protein